MVRRRLEILEAVVVTPVTIGQGTSSEGTGEAAEVKPTPICVAPPSSRVLKSLIRHEWSEDMKLSLGLSMALIHHQHQVQEPSMMASVPGRHFQR
jgi:hypothetical protein